MSTPTTKSTALSHAIPAIEAVQDQLQAKSRARADSVNTQVHERTLRLLEGRSTRFLDLPKEFRYMIYLLVLQKPRSLKLGITTRKRLVGPHRPGVEDIAVKIPRWPVVFAISPESREWAFAHLRTCSQGRGSSAKRRGSQLLHVVIPLQKKLRLSCRLIERWLREPSLCSFRLGLMLFGLWYWSSVRYWGPLEIMRRIRSAIILATALFIFVWASVSWTFQTHPLVQPLGVWACNRLFRYILPADPEPDPNPLRIPFIFDSERDSLEVHLLGHNWGYSFTAFCKTSACMSARLALDQIGLQRRTLTVRHLQIHQIGHTTENGWFNDRHCDPVPNQNGELECKYAEGFKWQKGGFGGHSVLRSYTEVTCYCRKPGIEHERKVATMKKGGRRLDDGSWQPRLERDAEYLEPANDCRGIRRMGLVESLVRWVYGRLRRAEGMKPRVMQWEEMQKSLGY